MSKPRTAVRCADCGRIQPRWTGRCPACQAWGTMRQETIPTARGPLSRSQTSSARPIDHVPCHELERISTGIGEVDRVLGGGLVRGVVALFAGEPGIGKSTLLLQIADAVAAAGRVVLYVSGEESAGQVRLRAERLGTLSDRLLVASETSLDAVLGLLEIHRPAALLLDSIQTISASHGPASGSISQVRECAGALVQAAKQTSTATVLVGHVTKEGTIAGPRVLEHLVDVVLTFEGDRHQALRLLRAVKNRFGPAGEVGCLEIADDGLREVVDPSRLFLAEHATDPTGVAVTVAVEGPRPLTVEVQALVAASRLAMPRRQASGLDPSRLALLVAVLERRCGLSLAERDLFASAVGGVRLREPAADLAMCMAIASSRLDRKLPRGLVAIGEVGLAGEVRAVPQLKRRLTEAARLGFASALVPARYDGATLGLQVHRVRDVQDCIRAFLKDSVPLPVPCPTSREGSPDAVDGRAREG